MFKMFIFNQKKEIERLKKEIISLNELLNIKASIKSVINKIVGNGIEWFDYSKLTIEQQRRYYNAAQDALENIAIKNEMNKIINDLSNWCLTKSTNYNDIEAMRYTVNGMKLLMERLEEIPNPDINQKEAENPYEVI